MAAGKHISKAAVLLSAVLVLGGCGESEMGENVSDSGLTSEVPPDEKATDVFQGETGRFVEENLNYQEKTDYIYGTYTNGSAETVFYSRENALDGSRTFKRNVLSNSGEFVTTDFEPLNKLSAEGYLILRISESPGGTIVANGANPDMEGDFIGVSVGGGDFQVTDISEEDMQNYPFAVLAYDEGYFVQFMMGFARQYSLDGKMIREYSGGNSEKQIALYGSNFAIVDTTGDSVTVYDIATGDALYTAPFGDTYITADPLEFDANFSLGMDGKGIYAASTKGIFRYDGAVWNLEVDGNLTSLSVPDMRIMGTASNGSEYFAFLGAPANVMRYAFDPSAPKNPDVTIEIFSLNDNMTIRKAAGVFKLNNPGVAVDFRVAAEGADGATIEDITRALNTEILAGNGPDLIVLDGLPAESYIEKGVLKDITALSDQLKTEGLFEGIAKSLEQDGKVYGLPSRFSVPIFLGDLETISGLTSLSVLTEQMGLHQSEMPALLKIPDEILIYLETTWPKNVIMDYYDICQDEFLTGKAIDEAALAAFYKNALAVDTSLKAYLPPERELFTYGASSAGGVMETIDMSMIGISEGLAKVYNQNLDSIYELSNMSSELGDMEGMGIASMFGLNKFYPSGNVGVLSSGENKELSEEFIDILISREVQDVYLSDGFPVNSGALQFLLDDTLIPPVDFAPDGTPLEPRSDLGFPALTESLTEPIFINTVIKEAVNGQIEGLIAGTTTPEQAAANVVNDTRLYLSE